MAGLSTDKNGRHIVQFTLGTRRTISLGRIPIATARKVHQHIEDLVAAARMQQSVEPRTATWVADLGDDMHKKLAAVGLVAPRKAADVAALGPFLDGYVAKRIDVEPATREAWKQTMGNLKDHFGADRDLATISEGAAEDFALFLLGLGLSPSTIYKRLSNTRMLFKAAKRHRLITSNPFDEVRGGASQSAEKFYVAPEMADRIIEACNPEWRLIVALARYAGLRCPNEVLSLRWSDINFDGDRILVTSSKTARVGKPNRMTWMQPRLRQELLGAFEALDPGCDDYIFLERRQRALGPSGWRGANLRTQFEKIIRRAGYATWPSLFNSLRASHETDLSHLVPAHIVCAWMGNSKATAAKHYLMTTDADFQRAAKALQHVTESSGTEQKSTQYAR